ncbi:hypothetical protein ACFXD5_02250 [Streptomyces sp. NPDC059385]|uniref:hypothetical protein n=1 Tax=Streptomyces sp. NPDC059385 TaxID=3346817 RepID=UPI00367CC11C
MAALAETDFLERLRDMGLRVRERRGEDGTLIGYVVALPSDRADAGSRPVSFSGSFLAYDLSLPRVRERFEPTLGPADWTVAERLVRDAILSSPAWTDTAAKMALLDGRGVDVAGFLMAALGQGVGVDRAVAALLAQPGAAGPAAGPCGRGSRGKARPPRHQPERGARRTGGRPSTGRSLSWSVPGPGLCSLPAWPASPVARRESRDCATA